MSYVKMKDPDEVLDYTVDWDAESALAAGEQISSSTWAVSPAGLTIDSDSNTTTEATATVSAGSAGTVYRLTNEVVTDQGRTLQWSVILRVEER